MKNHPLFLIRQTTVIFKITVAFAILILFSESTYSQKTPNLIWATYFGNGDSLTWEWEEGIARDSSGNIYITGFTYSYTGLATKGAFLTVGDSVYGDGFLAKFSPDGNLIWGTYFGGDHYNEATGVTTDKYGNVYITGITNSGSGIATKGAYRTIGDSVAGDGFLAKFSAAGSLLWSTYYGGNSGGYLPVVATDDSGNAYLSGTTFSHSGIATKGAFKTICNCDAANGNAFLAKFSPSGSLLWGTYFGDSSIGCSITTHAANIYLTGETISSFGIATFGTYQTSSSYGGAFLANFNSDGSLAWGTYYGENNDGFSVATDFSGNIYVTGEVYSTANGIATSGAFQTFFGGGVGNAFLGKFNDKGNLLWGTYFGGNGTDGGLGLAFDPSGNVYLAGDASDTIGIATVGAYQTSYGGGQWDGFISKFTTNGDLLWATYYGGSGCDNISGLITDASGNNLYITGYTNSNSGIATSNAYQDFLSDSGQWNAFLAKFQLKTYQNDAGVYSIFSPKNNICPGSTPVKVQLKNYGSKTLQSATINWKINGTTQTAYKWTGGLSPENTTSIDLGGYTFNAGTFTITSWASSPNGLTDPMPGNDTEQITIMVYPFPNAITGGDKSICPGSIINIGDTAVPGNVYSWTANPSGYTSTSSKISISPITTTTYYLTESTPGGCSKTDSVVITTRPLPPTPTIKLSGDTLKSSAKSGNQWLLNDSIIKGATNQKYIATTNGNYSLVATDTNGCSATSKQTNYTITGIYQPTDNLQLKIYPNPFTNQTTIEANVSASNPISISIYDMTGRLITGEENIIHPAGQFTYTFDAEKYSAQDGMYIVKLLIGNEVITREIVRLP